MGISAESGRPEFESSVRPKGAVNQISGRRKELFGTGVGTPAAHTAFGKQFAVLELVLNQF